MSTFEESKSCSLLHKHISYLLVVHSEGRGILFAEELADNTSPPPRSRKKMDPRTRSPLYFCTLDHTHPLLCSPTFFTMQF